MTKIKRLEVSTPQGRAGLLNHDSRYVFNYETTERERETSLTMPIRAESYAAGAMLVPFTMNMPEGDLKRRLENFLAKYGVVNPMRLLAATGTNQIGRLRYIDPELPVTSNKPQVGRKELLKSSSDEMFAFLLDAYLTSGISGIQPKVLIPDADREREKSSFVNADLIVKTAGEDFPHLATNEFLCMTVAHNAGLPVAPFWLSEDNGLFVMERFDLQGGRQLGFEDMMVLMNKSPETTNAKYQSSYEQIAKAISIFCKGEETTDSLKRLFEYVALSVMVRNGDAHLKNFGLTYEYPHTTEGRKLSPIYDVVTTSVYEHMHPITHAKVVDRDLALKLHKSDKTKNYPDRKQLLDFGTSVCLVRDPAEVIDRIADAMSKTLNEHAERVDKEFLERICKEWDGGRLSLAVTRFRKGQRYEPVRNATASASETSIGDHVKGQSLAEQFQAVRAFGEHTGIITDMSETEVIQHIGRGKHVVWDRAVLRGDAFNVGNDVTISKDGVVRAAQEKLVGRDR